MIEKIQTARKLLNALRAATLAQDSIQIHVIRQALERIDAEAVELALEENEREAQQ